MPFYGIVMCGVGSISFPVCLHLQSQTNSDERDEPVEDIDK